MSVIHCGERLYMENSAGFRWEPYVSENRIGIGCFYLNGRPLGKPDERFLYETVIGRGFSCSDFEIVENSDQRGVLRFFGTNGTADLVIEAAMDDRFSAVRFDYSIEPALPINHRLYVNEIGRAHV